MRVLCESGPSGLRTGSRSAKMVPLPTSLCRITTSPPCSRAILRVTASPSPVPLAPLVLMNGRKISACLSAAMPGPLSRTISRTNAPLLTSSSGSRPVPTSTLG